MGSRGAFVNADAGDFRFKEDGQLYHSVGEVDGVKVLVKVRDSVNAPRYSHTADRKYAVIQDGSLKHISFYDSEHKQSVCIDFLHSHRNVQPHKHILSRV